MSSGSVTRRYFSPVLSFIVTESLEGIQDVMYVGECVRMRLLHVFAVLIASKGRKGKVAPNQHLRAPAAARGQPGGRWAHHVGDECVCLHSGTRGSNTH